MIDGTTKTKKLVSVRSNNSTDEPIDKGEGTDCKREAVRNRILSGVLEGEIRGIPTTIKREVKDRVKFKGSEERGEQ